MDFLQKPSLGRVYYVPLTKIFIYRFLTIRCNTLNRSNQLSMFVLKVGRSWLSLLLLVLSLDGVAQEGNNVFSFLNMPTSAHATAHGGRNISLVDDDISLIFHNPALMANVSNRTIGLNFFTYMKGVKAGSAAYCQAHRERGTWGVMALFQGYGSMQETNAEGQVIGTFSALDMCLSGGYSYAFNDYWVGGATGKLIYSGYGEFSSLALGVDLGLNYYNEAKDISIGLAARNLGAQVKRFGDHGEKLPMNLEAGFTFGLGHAPLDITVTLVDLTCWSKRDYYSSNPEGPSGGRIFTNHLAFGADFRPTKNIYVAMGYSFRRGYEMEAAGSSHAAGLSFGAGLNLKKFKAGFSYAKYHVSMPTFAISVAYSI